MNDDGSTLFVMWIVGGLLGTALFAWVFSLVWGVNKSRWYQSKQLEITIMMAKRQGLTQEELDAIMTRPAMKQ